MQKSAFFEPYRSVGFITDSTPFDLKHLGQENFITVSTGKSWQVFNCDKLRCLLIAPQREHHISAIASIKDITFTTAGREIIMWKRTHEVTRLRPPLGGNIMKLMTIGTVLVSLSEDLHLYTWDCSGFNKLFSESELEDAQMKKDETANNHTGEEDANKDTNKGAPLAFSSTVAIYEHLNERIKPETHIEFTRPINDDRATITTLCHPQTYVNKLVVGWSNGSVELWNIRTEKMIHRFRNVNKLGDPALSQAERMDALSDEYGKDKNRQRRIGALSPSAVTVIEKSPALDVVAIGYASGNIVLFNLKFDEPIHVFHQADGPVSSLSFRTDGNPYLVSASSQGHLTLWDLKNKRLHSVMRYAHSGNITRIAFLPGLPILVSSGSDNAIHEWIYDQADFSGRWLRSRSGHSQPPSLVTFYNEMTMLTSGHDNSLRMFAISRDQAAREFSQGQINRNAKLQSRMAHELKLPRATAIAVNNMKEREWDNILTAHVNDAAGVTWNFENKAIGKYKLYNENAMEKTKDGISMAGKRSKGFGAIDTASATAVAISHCGNFGIIGTSDGRVERYNMQSGLYRGRYGKPVSAAVSLKDQKRMDREEALKNIKKTDDVVVGGNKLSFNEPQLKAVDGKLADTIFGLYHTTTITSIFSDSMNNTVVSTSLDHTVRFWNFTTFEATGVLCLGFPIATAAFCPESNLLAAATDDLRIHIIDIDAKRVVRRFKVSHRLTAMCFSPDGRVLVASQANGDVRVFDLPSGRLVDWFTFDKPVMSMAFSPRNDFLATVHAGSLGIFLWVNRSYFSHQFMGLTVPSRPVHMDLSLNNVYSNDDAEMTSVIDTEEARKRKADAKDRKAKKAKVDGKMADESEEEDEDEDVDEETKKEREGFATVVFAMKNPIDPEQMTSSVWGDLITLSGLPPSRWQQLPMLEQVRLRNKPKEGLKAPVEAPFFLGVQSGVESRLDASALKQQVEEEKKKANETALSRILVGQVGEDNVLVRLCASIPSTSKAYTMITAEAKREERERQRVEQLLSGVDDDTLLEEDMAALAEEDEDEDAEGKEEEELRAIEETTKYLMSLPPSHVDAEIRSLSVGDGDAEDVPKLFAFMRYLLLAVRRKRDFEFIQAVTNVFLKVHAEAVAAHDCLGDLSEELLAEQRKVWRHLEQFMHSNLAMINHFCNIFGQ